METSMCRLFLAFAALFFSVAFSAAQTGSGKTQEQLQTEINALFPDNTSGLITPFALRQTTLDMAASSPTVVQASAYPGADVGAQVNNALAAFGASPACGTVIIPPGTLSTQITTGTRRGCTLQGLGAGPDKVVTCVGLAVPAITADFAFEQENLLTIRDLRLVNSTCTSDGMAFTDTWYGRVNNVYIRGFSTMNMAGIRLTGSLVGGRNIAVWTIDNTDILNGYHGLVIDGMGSGAVISTGANARFQGNDGYGIRVDTLTCVQDVIFYGDLEGNKLGAVSAPCIQGGEIVIHFESHSLGPNAIPITLGPSTGVRIGGDLHVTSAPECVSLTGAVQVTVLAACYGAVATDVNVDSTSTSVTYATPVGTFITGVKDSPQASHPGLVISDNTPVAQGVGGGMAFQGNANGSLTTAGSIHSCKTSATASDIGFDMCIYTRQNASGNNVEAGRFLSVSQALQTHGLVATDAAPTVAAAQIGYGSTTVAAGSGTCPTGTVGGQTVLGCIVVNIAGTNRNVPFF